jgi:hypothetical protein
MLFLFACCFDCTIALQAGNVLLTDDGRAKLADFGVSKEVSTVGDNKAQTVVGTPYWMVSHLCMHTLYTYIYTLVSVC